MNVELKKQAKKLTSQTESAQILAQKVAHILQALGFKKHD